MNFYKQRLIHLRNTGFQPKVVYDIGAWQGKWTESFEEIFPNSDFYLFEANKKTIPFLEKKRHPFFIELLGDKERPAIFYTAQQMELGTGDSVFRENSPYYANQNCKEVVLQMTTLSSLVKKHHLPQPNLIKMDVQGSEKAVIEGGKDLVLSAEAVIIEVRVVAYNEGAPLFAEIIDLMDHLGFQMIDILEVAYLSTGDLVDMDLLFFKKNSQFIRTGMLVR